jgi:transposase InsO family protein
MNQLRLQYPIEVLTRTIGISRSGYYARQGRPPSLRARTDAVFKPLIMKAHKTGRSTYGSTRIQQELAEQEVFVGRDRIHRLRKELGLKCIQNKKFKATTNSSHDLPVAPNLLDQKFEVDGPGKVLGTDITYIPTGEGWLYLAGVKDFGSMEIVGYAMGARMTKDLVHMALLKAIRYRRPSPGCIHHSDRGSQYCAHSYQDLVRKTGMKASMSRKGNCYDNAPTESFWGSLKQEMVYHRRFRTRLEAQAAIQEWIEIFYNRIRRHTSLGGLAPARWAENHYVVEKSA